MLCRGSRSTLWFDSSVTSACCETVELVGLDDYLEDRSIERLRLWKLDVELHECAALAGAARLLKSQAIDAILIELSHITFRAVQSLLADAGYDLWRITRKGMARVDSQLRPGVCNLIALPRVGAGS